jgi:outer membrane protein assembly factor BamB
MNDAGNIVYIAAKKWVTAVDSRTGNTLWETEVPGSRFLATGFMTITADATGVYACRSGQVTALDPLDGTILWTHKTRAGGSVLPVVATLFGGADPSQAATAAAASQAQQAQHSAS